MKHFCFIAAIASILATSVAHAGNFEWKADYTQSSDIWVFIREVTDAGQNLAEINRILNQRYGTYEIAFGQARASYLLNRWRFWIGGEGVGIGRVQNPVVPELHASTVFALKGGASHQWDHYQFGVLLGGGIERKVDAFSTDLIEKLPIRTGPFYWFGLEQRVEYLADPWRFTGECRELFFRSDTPRSPLDFDENANFVAVPWKLKFDFTTPWFQDGGSRLEIQGIVGPHPFPDNLLPDVWDYLHRTLVFPEWGVMLGTGRQWNHRWNDHFSIRANTGFFGGYWGFGVSSQWKQYSLQIGSWGVESSSAFQTLGQRISRIELGFHL